jgi:signal transduction histidine kinase/ActR/RegA family two-component response regulator
LALVTERTERLLADQFNAAHRHTDRLFAVLMPLQWIVSVLAVFFFAPPVASGAHDYRPVWSALLVGGCITVVPVYLALWRPGRFSTRQVIAVAQISWSALLIHLTSGQLEAQFHVFISLAMLACYRDWRVLATATAVVACEQLFRGVIGPLPTLALLEIQVMHSAEHLAWVAFEDGFLLVSMRQSVREMSQIARQQAQLEESNETLTLEFGRRTRGFQDYSDRLELARRALEEQAGALERQSLELLEANASAVAANRAKSEFLANVSHEVRIPMTAVLGFADILLADLKEPQAVAAAKTIKRNAEFLLEIINGILDLSKIEAGRLSVERIRCSPHQIVSDVAVLMQVRAHAKGLHLNIEYESEIPATILSDPTRIRQILINLVGNAVKFSERGDIRLVVRLARGTEGEQELQFDVIDQGIGISPRQINGLFQAFAQADVSTVRKFGGSGLGLAISRRLAELLGGSLECMCSEPGRGSTFRATIAPGSLDGACMLRHLREPPAAEQSFKPLWSGAVLDCRVLLAEDSPDNQELVSFVLSKAGAQVSLANDGAQAVEMAMTALAAGRPFDVIVMDMQMPVLDGYAAASRLRALDYHGPIIALTAHAMRDDLQKSIAAGCDAYASKPIDGTLVELIARHAVRSASSATPAVSG